MASATACSARFVPALKGVQCRAAVLKGVQCRAAVSRAAVQCRASTMIRDVRLINSMVPRAPTNQRGHAHSGHWDDKLVIDNPRAGRDTLKQ